MKVEICLADASEADLASLAEAMLLVAEEKGLAVKLPERRAPYTMKEACAALNLTEKPIYALIEAGRLVRVAGLSKMLVTACSLHAFQEGRG